MHCEVQELKNYTDFMKKTLILSLAFAMFTMLSLQAQDLITNKELPSVNLKDMEGNLINTASFDNEGKPIVINFWATWCKPCVLELTTIQDEYKDWVEETGVKIIAISIDDARNSNKVAPFVNGRGWEYEVYIDENGDLKREMGVVNVPHTFLLNGKKEIIWDHNSFSPGDEDELFEQIKKAAANEGGEKKE